MGKLSRGWELTKLSFNVIGKDKEILLFPVISGIALILMAALFFGVCFFAFGFENNVYLFAAFFIAFNFLSAFVVVFFNVRWSPVPWSVWTEATQPSRTVSRWHRAV